MDLSIYKCGLQKLIYTFICIYNCLIKNTLIKLGKRLPPLTMNDIPNIPGMRRDISTTHPILYRQYKASRSQLQSSTGDSLYQMDQNGNEVIPTVECDFSFTGKQLL